ncbi:Rv2175c family DNA-binding protein [Microbacterium aureliae]
MTADSAPRIDTPWLSLAEVAAALGETPGRVHRLLDEHHLIGSRRGGSLRIPALFIKDERPLPSLRGTVIALHDAGFDDDEAIDWLLTEEDTIGAAPIEALRAGRKSEVRRVARTLA